MGCEVVPPTLAVHRDSCTRIWSDVPASTVLRREARHPGSLAYLARGNQRPVRRLVGGLPQPFRQVLRAGGRGAAGHVPRVGVTAVRTESPGGGSGHRGAHDRRTFHGSTKGGRSVAGQDRMTIEEVVRKVLLDEHADVIRESVEAIAREIMEAEVSELIGAELGERRP